MKLSKYFTVFILLLSVSCTKAGTPNVNVTVPVSSAVSSSSPTQVQSQEQSQDQDQVDITKLPDYPAQPVAKGSPAPEDGVLISPRNAAEAALNAAEAERLSVENSVLNKTRDKELSLMSEYQTKLEKENEDLKRQSWWDKNGNATMFGIGVATGVAVSLAIFKLAVKVSDSSKQQVPDASGQP